MDLLRRNEPLATDAKRERQQNVVSMLLIYESEKLTSSYTPSEIYSIHHFLQRSSRVSQTPIPLLPKWFIASCEIELQHSKAWVVGNSVEYGTYFGLPAMIKYQVIEDSDHLMLFVQCVESWYKLQHPGLLRLYGAYHVGNRAFIVYEKTSTETLESYLHRHNSQKYGSGGDQQDQYRMAWRLLYQVAAALVFLHGHSIFNMDLNMRSVIISGDGNAKLRCNFGSIGLLAQEELPLEPKEVPDVAIDATLFGDLIYNALLLVDPVKNQIVYGRRSFMHGACRSSIERLRSKHCSIDDVLEEMGILTGGGSNSSAVGPG